VAVLLWYARPTAACAVVGVALVAAGEVLRIVAARFIGPQSRTRTETVGELARGGPYRYSRNPLYIANLVQYAGLAIACGRWAGCAVPLLLGVHYHFVVAWEESRLLATHGDAYRAYCQQVPRWIGPFSNPAPTPPRAGWGAALRAERGTLLVLAVVLAALGARWWLV